MPEDRGPSPLIGRDEQVAAFRRHLLAARDGRGARLVLVHGLPGAGTTSFVEAFFGSAEPPVCPVGRLGPTPTEVVALSTPPDDVHVVVGLPWERDEPGALRERILAALPSSPPESREPGEPRGSTESRELQESPGSGDAVTADVPPGSATRAAAEGVSGSEGVAAAGARLARRLVAHAAAATAAGRAAFVLAVEEAEAADALSLRELSSAVHRCGDARVLVVVCATLPVRPATTPHPLVDLAAAHRSGLLELGPLSAADVQRLAADRGRSLLPRTAARIVEHTGGWAGDVLDLVSEHPDLDAHAAHGALPPSRRGIARLGRRLAAACDETRRLVEAAAVLSAGTTIEEIARIGGLDDPLPAVDEAVLLGILTVRETHDGPVARFVTPDLQACAHALLPFTERRRLHGIAADVVADAGERLRQRAGARTGPDEALVTELVAHAATDAADGRWEGAARSLSAALPVSRPGHDRDDLLVRTLDALTGAGDIPQASLLVPQVESLPHRAAGDAALAYVAMNEGRKLQAAHLLARAWVGTNPRRDPEGTALVAQRRALHALLDWHADDLVAWANHTQASGGSDLHPALEAQVIVGLGHGAAGRPEEAVAAYEATERIGHGPQAQRALMGHGWLDLAHDRVHQAAWRLQTSAPATYLRGSTRVSLWSLAWLARTRLVLGEWDAALESVAEAERLVDVSGIGAVSALVHWTGAEIHALRGDDAQARRHAVASESGAQEYTTTLVPSALARAHVNRARGDHLGVLRACEPLLALRRIRPVDEPGFWPWQDVYADALVAAGRLDEADEFLAPLERVAAERDHRSTRVRLTAARGRLLGARGDLAGARSAFEAALAVCGGLPMPYLRATTLFAQGVALRHAGHRREAAEPLEDARELFVRLGAAPLVSQCDRELGAGRAGVGRDDGPTERLTPQEEAVIDLVARGHKNRNVAAELFVSVKTVEYHLTRIYAKVGVASRGELAAWHRGR